MRRRINPAQMLNRARDGMRVDLQIADSLADVDLKVVDPAHIEQCLNRVHDVVDLHPDSQVCIRICDEAESQYLNQTYRQRNHPTNVLSFSAQVDIPELVLLGDLAICWPVVEKEARTQNKTPGQHLMHLLVHGVLHLAGYDHEQAADAQHMEALEVKILHRLGIANPYCGQNAGL